MIGEFLELRERKPTTSMWLVRYNYRRQLQLSTPLIPRIDEHKTGNTGQHLKRYDISATATVNY